MDAVDGFCEGIAFSPAQIARVFDKAKALGLPVKLHAEQLSNLGGAALAARNGALSSDHLEHLDEAGVLAMAEAGTVAVLLPGAFYTLRETQSPPVDLLRKHDVPMAISTDCNPGTSPLTSLLLTINMACTLFRLDPGRGPAWRNPATQPRPSVSRIVAFWPKASAPISPSGMSPIRQSWLTASVSTPLKIASGEVHNINGYLFLSFPAK